MLALILLVCSSILLGGAFFYGCRKGSLLSLTLSLLRSLPVAVCMALGLSGVILALDLGGYSVLKQEITLAKVTIEKVGIQRFVLNLQQEPFSHTEPPLQEQFEVLGDDWRLDLRLLYWEDWLPSQLFQDLYQLDRLSGRYSSIADAKTKLPSVHAIHAHSRKFDVWSLAQKDLVPWLRPQQGVGVYAPMVDGAGYKVSLSGKGIRLEPLNERGLEALEAWNR